MYSSLARTLRPLLIVGLATLSSCAHHTESANSTGAAGNGVSGPACNTGTTPFCDAHEAVPSGWTGHRFRLLQDYADAAAAPDAEPWKKYDFATQPREYIFALLTYAYGGNYGTDWDSPNTASKRRHWFHAPALDYGDNGREAISGLTRERTSTQYELGYAQIHCWDNWAVGLYNDPGGYTLGKVWNNRDNPDASAAKFPEGTMAVKLLFTSAPVTEVPWLDGSPEWDADIYEGDTVPSDSRCASAPASSPARSPQKVRLLQVDVAVKDSRANPLTGWVFGTFVFQANQPQPELVAFGARGGWRELAPVGLMWGNDPGLSDGEIPQQTWLNPQVRMMHVGYQGRLDGPIDNKISSCLSCHGTAQVPIDAMIPPSATPGRPPPDVSPWFQNVPSGVPFEKGHISTDYSLQIAFGIKNFEKYHPSSPSSASRGSVGTAPRAHLGTLETTSRPFSPRDPPYVKPSDPINLSSFHTKPPSRP
jgi:hypothetical protein